MAEKRDEKPKSGVRVEAIPVFFGLTNHLAIVCTDEHLRQTGIRGGPSQQGVISPSMTDAPEGNFGPIAVTEGEYRPGFVDYAPQAPKVEVNTRGQSVQDVQRCFRRVGRAIEGMSIQYEPATTNSNSVVGTMLRMCGCDQTKPTYTAPGFDKDLVTKEDLDKFQ